MFNHQVPYRDNGFNSLSIGFSLTRNITLEIEYERFKGWNNIGSDGDIANFGYGSSRVKLKRIGPTLKYNFNINDGRITFSPLIGIRLERSNTQQQAGYQITNIFDGNNTLGLYKGYAEVNAIENTQLIKNLGVGFKFNLIAGLNFIACVNWSFGSQIFQEMKVHYSYYDEQQPTAHVVNRGSGFIRTIGIQYDLNLLKPIFEKN